MKVTPAGVDSNCDRSTSTNQYRNSRPRSAPRSKVRGLRLSPISAINGPISTADMPKGYFGFPIPSTTFHNIPYLQLRVSGHSVWQFSAAHSRHYREGARFRLRLCAKAWHIGFTIDATCAHTVEKCVETTYEKL